MEFENVVTVLIAAGITVVMVIKWVTDYFGARRLSNGDKNGNKAAIASVEKSLEKAHAKMDKLHDRFDDISRDISVLKDRSDRGE